MTRSLLPLTVLALALGSGSVACGGEALDLSYARLPGVDPTFTRLDVYHPDQGRDHPVLIHVHGGGWKAGDKRGVRGAPNYLGFWQARGYVVVSINFRLWPEASYDEQCADIAAALAWVKANVARYRGSPSHMLLLGHSSGAHLVSLVGTDPAYLGAHGMKPADLKAVISSDIMAYDVRRAVRTAVDLGSPQAVDTLRELIGPSRALHASPVAHVRPDRRLPRFLLLHAPDFHGQQTRLTEDQANHFGATLRAAGHSATVRGFPDQSHNTLIGDLGLPGHGPTAVIDAFLGTSATPPSLEERVGSAVEGLVDPSGQRADTTPGLVAAVVTPDERRVFTYGVARLGGPAPDADTRFPVASVTKTLVGLIAADEVGPNLSVDEPINRLLPPELALRGAFGGQVTLRHLLSHRSGLPAMPSNLVDRDGDGRRDPGIPRDTPAAGYDLADLERELRANPLRQAPGQRYGYSNLGSGLLGRALQTRLRCASFDALLQARIAAPLGLRATQAASALLAGAPVAQGYAEASAGLREAPVPTMGVLGGAGEAVTTGRDMLTLLGCLTGRDRGPLEAAAARLAQPLASIDADTESGYALEIEDGVLSKAGSCAGYTAFLCYRRDRAVGVVLLANRGRLRALPAAARALVADLAEASGR
jgi:CubicO group peptidase (beta-lactamase class C family)